MNLSHKLTTIGIAALLAYAFVCPALLPDNTLSAFADAATITDDCNQAGGAGAVTSDIYGFGTASGDVGFGDDSRYASTKAPAVPPTESTMWNAEYSYLQYAVSGQNVITVTADFEPSAVNVFPAILCYAHSGGNILEVNNKVVQSSSNWTRISYTYIIGTGCDWVRILPTSYKTEDASVDTWMQQITKVVLEYADPLPEKDPVVIAPVYSDPMNGNAISGQRADLYNLAVRTDRAEEIGDSDRIVFGGNPDATESYIDYEINGQDTVVVTAYEPILENDVRPENATTVKFGYYGHNIWEVAATKTEVETGNYAARRWTKIIFTYELGAVDTDGKVRVMIYKPTEGQAEIQLGRVDIYDSNTANLQKLNAKFEIERYAILKNQNAYSTANWDKISQKVLLTQNAIDEATDEDLDSLLSAAKSEIDAIKTTVQEFDDAKAALLKELSDYAAAKIQSDYSEAGWLSIQSLLAEALDELETVNDLAQIEEIISDTKGDIDAVKTLAEEQNSSQSEQQSSSDVHSSASESASQQTSSTGSSHSDNISASSPNSSESGNSGCGSVVNVSLILCGICAIGLLSFKSKKKEK